MKGPGLIRLIWQTAVGLAVVGFCCPQLALAATTSNNRTPVITDVRLHEEGILLGQVVTGENVGLAGAQVSLTSANQQLAVGKTDKNGYFTFTGLRNGLYQVAAAEGHGVYRVWTRATAPPSAQPGVLIVAGNGTIRAQDAMGGLRGLLSNPWILTGIVATAIAVPVAIHNADREPATP